VGKPRAYYNENDLFAAAWLRALITAGLIAEGDVDDRDIRDVRPADVRGYVQCHFFAGIGGWSYALRLAGWPDARAVWTGSCPCQPFSAAGRQTGGDDPRHLWPVWFRLVRECRPAVVFGEQVENALGHGWLDLVCDDLEGEGYAVGAVGLPGACVGAYDIRQRLWFVADDAGARRQWTRRESHPHDRGAAEPRRFRPVGELGDSRRAGLQERVGHGGIQREALGASAGQAAECGGDPGDLDLAAGGRRERLGPPPAHGEPLSASANFWADAEWIPCRDGKARPVEPGTFPLAHGVPARVGRLRGYGNAIKPQVAHVFIEAYLSLQPAARPRPSPPRSRSMSRKKDPLTAVIHYFTVQDLAQVVDTLTVVKQIVHSRQGLREHGRHGGAGVVAGSGVGSGVGSGGTSPAPPPSRPARKKPDTAALPTLPGGDHVIPTV
jgi:DNA (cytosine-5)-methyltransferase 1